MTGDPASPTSHPHAGRASSGSPAGLSDDSAVGSATENADAAASVVVVGTDEQDAVHVELDRWVAVARSSLLLEGVTGPAELNLLFVDEEEMAVLNQRFMGQGGATDVLSFPLDPFPDETPAVDGSPPPGGDQPSLAVGAARMLGDVVICPSVAKRNAPTHAGTYDDELALLVVHGVLHVLGHDHAEDGEAALMRSREQDLLSRFHRTA